MAFDRDRPLDTSRPALLVDGGSCLDLGLVRSLGLAGVPVHLLGHNASSLAARSRFVAGVHAFPPPTAPDDARLGRLREIVAGFGRRPIVLPTGDTALAFLSRSRRHWDDVLDHDLASPELIERCLSKDRFAQLAAERGLPVPTTFVPRDAAEARTLATDLAFPVFVKPAHHDVWARLPPRVVAHVRGQVVDNAADLVGLFERLERHGAHRAVVQELVPGPDHAHVDVHAYLDSAGRVVGAFSGRKVRISPPHLGVGALVHSERVPAALEVAIGALRTLGYAGMANVNLKFDAGRGGFRLLEINCRYSTWTELATRCGCNLPLAAYAAITGQRPPALSQREGVAWLDFRRDWEAMAAYRREREWTWGSYARSLASVRHGAFFAWDDPVPFLCNILGLKGAPVKRGRA